MANEPKYFLCTKRLGFRFWSQDDFDLAFGLWGEIEVTKFIDARGQLSKNQVKERLAQEIATAESYGVQYWPTFLLSNDDHLGCFGLRPYDLSEGIYEIGSPDENSPVLITSNFSLTYFIVSGEMEASKVPSYLLVKDTEGLSVMTAWAAGKFVSDAIAPFVKKCGIDEKVKHHKLIIPGYAAAESGGLEEELPGWEVLVGPREGSHIPAYIKAWKP